MRHTPSPRRISAVMAPLLAAILATTTSAWAQTGTMAPQPTASGPMSGSLSKADQEFIQKTAAGGQAEVDMARLAQEQTRTGDVVAFANRMVEDHGRANQELRTLAAARGVSLPAPVTAHNATTGVSASEAGGKAQARHATGLHGDVNKLTGLSGDAFDREYAKLMVAHHKTNVQAFQRAAASAQDPELKAFAQRTLPTLQEHLKMAQAMHDRIGGARTGGDGRDGKGAGNPNPR